MELFVINRHGEERIDVNQEEEQNKVDAVLRRIERKKQQRIRQRERQKNKAVGSASTQPSKTSKTSLLTPELKDNKGTAEAKNYTKEEKKEKLSDISSFTVLGSENKLSKAKAHRVLPQWLLNPTVISANLKDLSVKVSKMKQLDKSLRNKLKANGIHTLFPVQATVVPWLIKSQKFGHTLFPQDVCVSAPTGSGKTLAFVLPIVQALKDYSVKKIRALVILPTQDLAEQVYKTFKTYAKDTTIDIGLITGKNSFNIEQKQLVYHNEVYGFVSKIDVLVCTAGRLVNHLKATEGFSLHFLEYLVIDEADRVLENEQDDWLYHFEKHVSSSDAQVQSKKILNVFTLQKKRPPQKLLFSATLSQDPEKLEKMSLFQPKLFTTVGDPTPEGEEDHSKFVGRYTTPKELIEKYIECTKDLKPLVLYKFIKQEQLTKTLVFTHSLESAHRLKILLKSLFKDKLKIEEISSSMKGKSRDVFISNFSCGQIDILICTDALARGIDLPGVKCVISYSVPKYLKTYIHRVGRTARAGESGLAVTVLNKEQSTSFKALLSQMKKDTMEQIIIDEEQLVSLTNLYKKSLNKLKQTVRKEEKSGFVNLLSKKKSLQRKQKNGKRRKTTELSNI